MPKDGFYGCQIHLCEWGRCPQNPSPEYPCEKIWYEYGGEA